jgi:phenylalanyl-tRNA synthetase alpha chain
MLPDEKIVNAVQATHEYGWTCNSTGWQYKWVPEFAKKLILRTHTTSLSARTLATLRNAELPAKFFSVGRCFRNETLDWKHLAEFYQTDGIVVGEDVTFRHLLGYLTRYFTKLGFPKARFRPSYFPYTEMSVEIEVLHPVQKKWLELGGAGIFRPEVVKPLLGKDIPVLAWGPGFERLVMVNYNIQDIREMYWNDLKQLREARIWTG